MGSSWRDVHLEFEAAWSMVALEGTPGGYG
jgi:hypothetical protein